MDDPGSEVRLCITMVETQNDIMSVTSIVLP